MKAGSSKRGKVTPESQEESRRLKRIWDERRAVLIERGHGTQETFGAAFGIGNQSAVGFFLNGQTTLSPKAAAAFARGLGCAIDDFSPRLAKLLSPATSPTGAGHAGASGTGSLTPGGLIPEQARESASPLATAASLIARHMRDADAMTREAVAPWLAKLASAPEEVGRITRTIESLISAEREQPAAPAESVPATRARRETDAETQKAMQELIGISRAAKRSTPATRTVAGRHGATYKLPGKTGGSA